MLKIKKKKKVFDFKYKIYWKNGSTTEGDITNSKLAPEDIFLTNAFTYFSKGICVYYNANEIRQIEISDLVEKVE